MFWVCSLLSLCSTYRSVDVPFMFQLVFWSNCIDLFRYMMIDDSDSGDDDDDDSVAVQVLLYHGAGSGLADISGG